MSENVSRRKMLSMLGLGAALGFTLSAVLEPLEAEAQEAAPATPPAAAPAATGTHGMQRRQERRSHRSERPLLAMSDGIRAAPVNLRQHLRPPQQLQRNSDPRAESLNARADRQTKRTRKA